MEKANMDIRKAFMAAGIKQWQLAEAVGMEEAAFSRKLRKELPQEKKQPIFEAIDRLTSNLHCNDLLARAKEVREVKDNAEAARLVQSGNWIIVQAAMQGEEICWVLIRI